MFVVVRLYTFHFFPKIPRRVGVDISPDQISVASQKNPDCEFICDDFLDFDPDSVFDIVTCFWQGYYYSKDVSLFCNKMINHVNPGGSIYIEILLPEVVKRNVQSDSKFTARNIEGDRWAISDPYVGHVGMAPPVSFFKEIFSSHFKSIQGFVSGVNFQMICTEKG